MRHRRVDRPIDAHARCTFVWIGGADGKVGRCVVELHPGGYIFLASAIEACSGKRLNASFV